MDEKNEIITIDKEFLMSKIYFTRGQKVMLDFDLAEIYGYETKRFNQQVSRNIEKFDEDFMFKLNEAEFENLRSQNVTSSWGGTRYLPYAFTEQGIYMLMTVLKGDLATKQSKALIRMFKKMKDFILENQGLIGQREFIQLSMQVTDNVVRMQDLKKNLMDVEDKVAGVVDDLSNFVQKSELSDLILDFSNPQVKRAYLVLNGQPVEADLAYKDIYSLAKKSIYVIDNYIGLKTLVLLKDTPNNVEKIIFSDNLGRGLHSVEYNDFCREYPGFKIKFKKSGGSFHDRYIVLDWGSDDARIYHCGASSKDAGERIMTVSELTDHMPYKELIDNLLKKEDLIIS